MAPKKPRGKHMRFDPSDQHRNEIEERTALGETCEQTAAHLRQQGVNITAKTISRRRLEWGLRQRPPHALSGKKITKPRPSNPHRKGFGADARKQEIQNRTDAGQTAEQIAEALTAQGWELKRGASTVVRLQTFWGLIPFDEDRNRGRKKSGTSPAKPRPPKPPRSPKVSKREQEREANREQQTSTMHYPTNCSFGPKKRADGSIYEDDIPFMGTELMPDTDSMTSPSSQHNNLTMTHNVAAEVMSVEILIDLASSTLSAAHGLKDMLLAYQGQSASQTSTSAFPPTLDDLAIARKKVREAAGLMLDLAADPGA